MATGGGSLVFLGVVLVVLEVNIEHCFLNSEQRSQPSLSPRDRPWPGLVAKIKIKNL